MHRLTGGIFLVHRRQLPDSFDGNIFLARFGTPEFASAKACRIGYHSVRSREPQTDGAFRSIPFAYRAAGSRVGWLTVTIHSPFPVKPAAITPFRTVREIVQSSGQGKAHDAMANMACFVSRHLTGRHAELGRAGPICPFARQGSATGGIRFADCAALPGEEARIVEIMAQVRRDFLRWGEGSGIPQILRACVVTFSALEGKEDAAMIERVQRRLKPEYVESGLMIGQFFPGCDEGGIRNPAFRPLDAPVISLAVRFMTLADAPFMLGDPRFRAAFVAQHGADGERELLQAERTRREHAG